MDPSELEKNTIADGYSAIGQDADPFVPVPDTADELNFGIVELELAKVSRMRPVPIRLVNGKHYSNGGYGVAHILFNHATTIALFDYYSVQDFVSEVAEDFDAVYAGRENRHLIVRKKGTNNMHVDRLLVLELDKSGEFYSVVTGFTVSSSRQVNGVLVAERVMKDGKWTWKKKEA